MAGLNKKAPLAHSFSIKSLEKEGKPPNYDFADYMSDLYEVNGTRKPPKATVSLAPPQSPITTEEVIMAMKKTGHKATGMDLLSSKVLKDPRLELTIAKRLKFAFNEFIKRGTWP